MVKGTKKVFKAQLVISIIGILSILVGVSFAIFSIIQDSEKKQVIKTGAISLLLTEEQSSFENDLEEMTDVDGLLQTTNYKFSLTNDGSSLTKYKIYLVDDTEAVSSYGGTLLDDKYVMAGLKVNGTEVGPINLETANRMIVESTIQTGETIDFELRLWINFESLSSFAKLEQNGRTIFLNLKVEGEQITGPIISEVYSGGMIYTDPNFSTGLNSTYVYNWYETNGTVTNERVAMETPVGNYALQITTSGVAGPGLGGFTFKTRSAANKVMVTRILAKIPVGYSIEWNSNQIGDDRTNTWLTSTEGTGDWQEYVHVAIAGSTGTFDVTNFYYLNGTAATTENPVVWQVAYATVYSNQDDYTQAGISFKAENAGSGIVAYGINRSSTTEPDYITVESTSSIGRVLENITENGTYYIWVKDAAGSITNKAVTVSNISN